MQYWRDARQEEDAWQEDCRTVEMLHWKGAARQEGCRTGGMQDKWDAGLLGCRTGGMQDWKDL